MGAHGCMHVCVWMYVCACMHGCHWVKRRVPYAPIHPPASTGFSVRVRARASGDTPNSVATTTAMDGIAVRIRVRVRVRVRVSVRAIRVWVWVRYTCIERLIIDNLHVTKKACG